MTTLVTDYVNVEERAKSLKCVNPSGLAILPENLEAADTVAEFIYSSTAATVRTLFENHNITFDELVPSGTRSLVRSNKSFEWVAPLIFISASLITNNPTAVSMALDVLSNYLTDFFKGVSGPKKVRVEFIVEAAADRTYKKLSYEGSIEGIPELLDTIKALNDGQNP